ncbi:MAG TPA: hypothetical protein VMY98_03455 [Anaerolineae bacterium]|nr:hypothetical protein [Anaerolineae bacterium]
MPLRLRAANGWRSDKGSSALGVKDSGLASLLFHGPALERCRGAGWRVEAVNTCLGKARPTPRSEVLGGVGIDVLPVAETVLEWCVLVAEQRGPKM